MWRQIRIEREADAERSHDVETVAGFQSVQSARAGAGDLVEELDLAPGGVGAVDAHRAPQERLLAGRLRAKQLKELAGRSRGRGIAATGYEVAVLRIDRVIGDDFGQLRHHARLPTHGRTINRSRSGKRCAAPLGYQ